MLRTLVVVAAALGCHAPRATLREPPRPVTATYTSTMVDVRTTLGRALIGVETRGVERERRSTSCNSAVQASCMRCELAAPSDAIDLAALAEIKAAFDRYPSDVLAVSKIQHVALCRKLVEEPGRKVSGTADVTEHRMFVSLEHFLGRTYDPGDAQTPGDIVHHELFHLFEYEVMHDLAIDDVAWRAQNPAGFAYKTPDAETTRPFGFVNVYASTNDREDRASVFELLMSRPDELCALAKDDPIVRAKIQLIWERIAIVTGDAFLRQRATCVTWIAPTTPRVEPPRPRIRLPPQRDHAWLVPPVRPRAR